MMTFKSLRQSVFRGFMKVTFENGDKEEGKIHKLIASAIVYRLVQDILSQNPAATRDITETIASYADTYKVIIENMSSKYVVYGELYKTVKDYGLNSFLDITETQIKEINKIYENKAEVKLFEAESFSQYMYKIAKTNISQLERLRKIHYDIIVPIVDYYVSRYAVSFSSTVIHSADGVTDNPGKEIKFYIRGIVPSTIVRDIKQDKMKITKYIYNVYVEDDKVVLIIK